MRNNSAGSPAVAGSVGATTTVAVAALAGATLCWYAAQTLRRHHYLQRGKDEGDAIVLPSTLVDEDDDDNVQTLHSIVHHFASLQLASDVSVEEANKRRTASYYLKSREAHARQRVKGVSSYRKLLKLRQHHIDQTLLYSSKGTHSHRTVLVMCDATTASILEQARETILGPLQYSHDMATRGAWVPRLDMIPPEDMHVTVAIPWWWHTMPKQGNYQLSQELAARFKQTLFLKFHHAFQIELQRIVLLGGKTLVALWRCVGERVTEDGHVVYDRHGESVDPFVRLRVEIVRCFTTESQDNRLKPLTYQDVIQQVRSSNGTLSTSSIASVPVVNDAALAKSPIVASPPPPPLPPRVAYAAQREHSIEMRTPGLGQGDGFIHTTLCRLPLDCLSQSDVSLEDVHRLCREASSTLSGHRMVVSKFRFLETTGRGGESNPCVDPIYDEFIEAPSRFRLRRDGNVSQTNNLHIPQNKKKDSWKGQSANRTIGAIRNRVADLPLDGLFDGPATDETISTAGSLQEELVAAGTEEEEMRSESMRMEITAPILM